MTKNSLIDIFTTISVILILNSLFESSLILSTITSLVWIVFIFISNVCLRKQTTSAITAFLFNSMISFSVLIFSLIVLYLFFGLTNLLVVLTTLIVSLVEIIKIKKLEFVKPKIKKPNFNRWMVLAITSDILILALALYARTSEAIFSPWNVTSFAPFILFFIATILLLIGIKQTNSSGFLIAGIVHTLTFLGISVIIYEIGFGFDPFIHRAAEAALLETSKIEPLTPLYLGQYLLVGFLQKISGISLSVVDAWLVPLIASVALPIGVYTGLVHGFKIEKSKSYLLWLLAFLIPVSLITFTTPFSFTYLWFFIWIFQLPLLKEKTFAEFGFCLLDP